MELVLELTLARYAELGGTAVSPCDQAPEFEHIATIGAKLWHESELAFHELQEARASHPADAAGVKGCLCEGSAV